MVFRPSVDPPEGQGTGLPEDQKGEGVKNGLAEDQALGVPRAPGV